MNRTRLEQFKEYYNSYTYRVADMAGGSSFAFVVWHLSLMMAIWGTWLILPLGTFEGLPYATMSGFASEMAWGLVALGLGAGKMHFVTAKRTISLSMLCLVTGFFWMMVGVSFLFADPGNTGGVAYIMLGLLEFWFYKRLQGRNDG